MSTDDTSDREELDEMRARLADLPNALGLAAQMSEGLVERSGLDLRTLHLVRIAALAATGAPAVSWQVNLELMDEHVSVDDIDGVLTAIAPIIGTSRYLEAVSTILDS